MDEVVDKKIDDLLKGADEYLRSLLQRGNCVGYSFYSPSVNKDNNDVEFKSRVGIRLAVDGEEILIGANVKYTKSPGHNKTYVTLNVDYVFECGRDRKFVSSDTINFLEGQSWDESHYKISTTKLIFGEVERMVAPVMTKSLMPFM
jgi:hypothetical protein